MFVNLIGRNSFVEKLFKILLTEVEMFILRWSTLYKFNVRFCVINIYYIFFRKLGILFYLPAKFGAISAALANTPAGIAAVIVNAAVYKAAGAAGSHPVYPKTNIKAAGGK